MSNDESRRLADRYRNGESAVAGAIFDLYVSRLIGFVRRNHVGAMRRRFDPDDIVQSVMGSFFVRLRGGKLDVDASGALWRILVAMTANKLRENHRFHLRKMRSVRAEESVVDGGAICGLPLALLQSEPSPDDEAALRETLQAVMEELAPPKRHIVQLHLRGLSVAEVARRTKCTERTVQRTLRQLQDDLESRLDLTTADSDAQPFRPGRTRA